MVNTPHANPMENTHRRYAPWRTLDPNVARLLRTARRSRGWSYRRAARHVGVSHGLIAMLEAAKRRPSTVVAEALIAGYDLDADDARRLRAVALSGVGRDWRPT